MRPSEPDGTKPGRPPVSVIIPVRNAEATLPETLRSVLSQDYEGAIEVIVADGSDTRATAEMIGRRFPGVRVIPNARRDTSSALNAALGAAAHSIIVRCDAHSFLPAGYVARAVKTLGETAAANVGGRQNPVGRTSFERAVALAMTTPLGSGGARYRVGGPAGPADTVFLGVFRRDAVEAAGGFDPRLVRNQDYELNWRLLERGETVWFDPGLSVDYRPRGSFSGLARQYFEYGAWKRVVLGMHPASLRPRQLAAPLLVAGLAVSGLLGAAGAALAALDVAAPVEAQLAAAAVVPLFYLLALLLGSAAVVVRRRESGVLLVAAVLATMHLFWGAGFFLGKAAARR